MVKIPIRRAVLIALAAFFVLWSVKALGDENRRQLWLLSTRSAPLCGDLQCGQKTIGYWRYSDDCQWQASDEESFRGGDDPAVPTTIIIHGNQDDADDAVDFAWPIYCRMSRIACDRPFRLVIWSWPSEKICRRNRADVQLKISFCGAQAYYLAVCMDHMRGDVPVCLIGYSLGAPIAAGGLHLLAGGEAACRMLPGRGSPEQSSKRTAPIRAVMVGAAAEADCLASNGEYNLALSQVEKMLVERNCCDRVLKFYPRLYGRHGPQALGFVGPAGCGEYDKIELLDVSCEVGKRHQWKFYLTSQSLLESIDRYVFPADIVKEKGIEAVASKD
ncbi:MAG: hypothetical protein ABSG67_07875 [Thermoguttaceae bacterium]|jgi:hypothetical protein